MKRWDIWLIAGVLAAAGILFFSGVLRPGGAGAAAVVFVDGVEEARLPLDTDAEYTTKDGGNTISIQDGHAVMVYADCPDKLCIKQGQVHLEHESIVCLPNKVVVEIVGGAENPVDAVAK